MTHVRERVVVAMSGGVDSSVAAALLKEEGHDVIGATLQFRPCGDASDVQWCGSMEAQTCARTVAALLDIPHYVWDCHAEFDAQVLEPGWREYARGRTPNPCIVCNERLKWGFFQDQAERLGAAKIATGHYARVLRDAKNGEPVLARGVDRAKDQAYFLFLLRGPQLAATLFPLGERTKPAVRDLAARLGLPNAARPDSQDTCFAGKTMVFAEALRLRFGMPASPGVFVDQEGRILGRHDGAHVFTIGQRRGHNVALGRRAYVVEIRADSGEVVLSDDPDALLAAGLEASAVRWSPAWSPGDEPFECDVQVRYRQAPVRASVVPRGNDAATVRFATPLNAVTPGQAVVFYEGDRVLGGGWIDRQIPL